MIVELTRTELPTSKPTIIWRHEIEKKNYKEEKGKKDPMYYL